MSAVEQEKARQARNKYAREWRARNRDKVKANNQRYWARKAASTAEQEAENGGKDENH